MKTYSLLQFLNQPLNDILENDEDYCFEIISSSTIINKENKTISNITIPIIQRDYAQGRDENKDLRKEFIDKLFQHLESKQKLKLDFIYGSINPTNENSFLPLDGQQRLTTLYLLHWYIIKVETKDIPEEFEKYKSVLLKFSYETRDTSRRFFKKLVTFEFEDNPKKSIENSYWFNDHFSLDPTIKGALNTLQTIHEIYKSKEKRTLLSSLDKIVFYVLPMDQFKLTDDLYIKLNARGKVLSPFENFKADLIGFVKNDPTFEFKKNYNGFDLNHYDIIANKFDNTWSDLFWKETKKHLDDKESKNKYSVDSYFFRFLHRLIINDYIIGYTGSEINKDDIYKELLKKESELHYTNFDLYASKKLISSKFIKNLETLLDVYSKINEEIQQHLNPLWDKPAFKYSIYKVENYTMDDRMVFEAINLFILNSGIHSDNHSEIHLDIQKLKEWMRIVWNLISDPDIRSIEANKAVMTVIREIAIHSNDIYNNLVFGSLDTYIDSLNNIHKEQLIEEKEKAFLILKNNNREEWEIAIHNAESHSLYEGNIGFLLKSIKNSEHLNKRFKASRLLFNDKRKVNELLDGKNHSLIRYVITQFDSWETLQKFNFLSNEINWKTHLRRNENLKRSVLNLIELNDVELIRNEIQDRLNAESLLIEANTKQKLAHKNLYSNTNFHEWMQTDGVYKLKWREHHLFVIRPNAWYSKVMISGFRNELISALIIHFNLDKGNRECNTSGFYWGETIDFWKDIEDNKKVTFNFSIDNKLHIGLWDELNPYIIEDYSFSKDGWKQIYTFDIDEITSCSHVDDFISKVEKTLNDDSDCLIRSILIN